MKAKVIIDTLDYVIIDEFAFDENFIYPLESNENYTYDNCYILEFKDR